MDAHEMQEKLLAGLKDKTGRTLEEWKAVVKASGLSRHMEILKHLKDVHGLSYGHANTVAFKVLGTDAASAGSDEELIDGMFKGKEDLRKVYDRLVKTVQGLGGDVQLAPKKSYVSVRRKKQFAILQPSTKTRFDVGINLKGRAPEGRLKPAGSLGGMVSHKVELTAGDLADMELLAWLKAAYEQAG